MKFLLFFNLFTDNFKDLIHSLPNDDNLVNSNNPWTGLNINTLIAIYGIEINNINITLNDVLEQSPLDFDLQSLGTPTFWQKMEGFCKSYSCWNSDLFYPSNATETLDIKMKFSRDGGTVEISI